MDNMEISCDRNGIEAGIEEISSGFEGVPFRHICQKIQLLSIRNFPLYHKNQIQVAFLCLKTAHDCGAVKIDSLKWYQENPQDYVEKMKGVDRDLAAHFTIIERFGTPIRRLPFSRG
mgnify:CR=1 FL=1